MENSKSLKNEVVKGVLWGVLERFSILAIGFVITIFLARLLTPADYGLINMLAIFTVLALVILDGGFGQALIQKRDVTSIDYSSVFYFNLIFSILLYVLLYMSAPWIAEFYRQEELVSIARVSFLLIPINSLSIIQHTILIKNLCVKLLAKVSVVSSLLSGIVGLSFAYNGYGVWSLVFQTLTLYFIRSVMLWIVSKWRPVLKFNINSIKSIFRFSMSLLGVHTIAAIFQNIYTIIIGRYFSVNDVGYYNQAQRVSSIISDSISQATQRVAYPAFSKIQNDEAQLQSAYIRTVNLLMFLNFPIMLGIIVPAESLFAILLSDKWLPAVPYFRLLCIVGCLYPIKMINMSLLKSRGRGKLYFYLELVGRALLVVAIVITIKYDIYYLLLGYVVVTIINTLISMYYCGTIIKYSLTKQLFNLLPIFSITMLMILCVYLIQIFNLEDIVNISIQIIVGVVFYITISYIFRINALMELKTIILELLKNK